MNSKEILLFDNRNDADQLLAKQTIVELAIDGERWLFTKYDESYFLFEKHCPHFDYPLKESPISGTGEVVCPWHNYRFSLIRSGSESEQRCRPLRVIRARVDDQKILVAFNSG
ncbi:Rieske (2Fe-2S) protein [Marinoscillum furvescens]|uniref:Rieske-like 2Fe-2S protein n=1 Tax=Marinoscillum furvescens DSM 4134 TaxID=1122208 RepID=A0A3D9KZ31_MARFU|nr:Rieske 2Fe-2S domain-containing protein [Marinoscillum furvescens]RED94115.1 Rieske-like 2Fe-2S protein [Marinoscillum furvescens DSM 4134]